jgi:hypothetical protein
MAFFDQFGAGQANNGMGPANPTGMPNPQMTENFRLGGPGYQPPNMAGGLQAYLANSQGWMNNPILQALFKGRLGGQGASPGGAGGPPTQVGISPGAQMGPGIPPGMPGAPGGAPPSPQMGTMLPLGTSSQMNQYGGNMTNMANGMRPFLR